MDIVINYVAVLIAAISSMVVGFLWYGIIFRKSWMALMGYTRENMGQMKMAANKAYTIQFVASLVMAYLLAHMIVFVSAYLEMGGTGVGVKTGFFSWLGFIMPVTLGVVLWENKPWKLWLINTSHYLVMLVVMGAILGAWS